MPKKFIDKELIMLLLSIAGELGIQIIAAMKGDKINLDDFTKRTDDLRKTRDKWRARQ